MVAFNPGSFNDGSPDMTTQSVGNDVKPQSSVLSQVKDPIIISFLESIKEASSKPPYSNSKWKDKNVRDLSLEEVADMVIHAHSQSIMRHMLKRELLNIKFFPNGEDPKIIIHSR